jgi:hypothetical protein
MTGLHGFPNRCGKEQLSKIGVKTKVSDNRYFTENQPKLAKSGPPGTSFGKRRNLGNPCMAKVWLAEPQLVAKFDIGLPSLRFGAAAFKTDLR